MSQVKLQRNSPPSEPQARENLAEVGAGRSLWQDAMRRLWRNKLAVVCAVFIIFVILAAVFAPYVAPYNYKTQYYDHVREPSSSQYILGTDDLGRDILSRIIYGARISLSVGFMATFISITIGMVMGVLSGYFGGTVDNLIMRLVDFLYAFPSLLFALLIMSILPRNIYSIYIALSLTSWAGVARLVRGQVLALREREFTEAAKAAGALDTRIMFTHILPNTLSPVIVDATFGIGSTILGEAGLGFLGIGVQPPHPSWGVMIGDATPYFRSVPHMLFWPSLALALVILAFNILGDGLRDALDPRLKE